MGKLEKMTEKMFSSGHMFYGVWEKYIATLKDSLSSGFEMSAADRHRIMEFIAGAYEELGEKAEAVAWKARAMSEIIAEKNASEKNDTEKNAADR